MSSALSQPSHTFSTTLPELPNRYQRSSSLVLLYAPVPILVGDLRIDCCLEILSRPLPTRSVVVVFLEPLASAYKLLLDDGEPGLSAGGFRALSFDLYVAEHTYIIPGASCRRSPRSLHCRYLPFPHCRSRRYCRRSRRSHCCSRRSHCRPLQSAHGPCRSRC